MLSLIHNEVVVRHQWMTNAEFADIVAVSQVTPGPIAINSATYVGYDVCAKQLGVAGGIAGSIVATAAVCLPAMTLMLLATRFFLKLRRNRYVEGAMKGLHPAATGLIAAAALMLLLPERGDASPGILGDAAGMTIFAATAIAAYRKVNPILLIVLSAAVGTALYGPWTI